MVAEIVIYLYPMAIFRRSDPALFRSPIRFCPFTLESILEDQDFVLRIRSLIGSHFNHLGREWVLHEVLADEGVLVLSDPSNKAIIQENLFGEPSRKGPETVLIPLFGKVPDTLSEELLELLANKVGTDITH